MKYIPHLEEMQSSCAKRGTPNFDSPVMGAKVGLLSLDEILSELASPSIYVSKGR